MCVFLKFIHSTSDIYWCPGCVRSWLARGPPEKTADVVPDLVRLLVYHDGIYVEGRDDEDL